MSRPRNCIPKLCRHKGSGQAVVRIGYKDHYLGTWPIPSNRPPAAVQAKYDALVAEWLAKGRPPTVAFASTSAGDEMTVGELIVVFWAYVIRYYRRMDGTPTNEVEEFRRALKLVRVLYENLRAADFSPLKLAAVRQCMIQAGWSRGVINQRTWRVKRMFKWAVENEHVPPSVFHGLQAVCGLQRGRTEARETAPVGPVAPEHVEAVLPFLLPEVRTMVKVQRLTGMRPGEVCRMKGSELDMSGLVWILRPACHKNAWRGKSRVVCIGPKAQAFLRPFLKTDADSYLFSPREAMAKQRADRRAKRKTKVPPCQRFCRKARPRRQPGAF